MKVYIVREKHESCILGIFSSREKAERFTDTAEDKSTVFVILEYVLDRVEFAA